MGKTVNDFKEGRIERYRDRIEKKVSDPVPSQYWVTTRPTNPPRRYAAGSLSRCVDTNHPRFHRMMRARERHRHLRSLDIGGPLAIERSSLSMPNLLDVTIPFFSSKRGVFGVWAPTLSYKAAMSDVARGYIPPLSAELGITRADLRALGSTAIAKSIPDIPEFSLFRFVGELRAGLPKVPLAVLAKERKLRNTGGEYLNYQFGIAPLIEDLQKLFEALQDPALRSAVKHQLHEEHRVRKTLEKDSSSLTRQLENSEIANTIEGLAGQTGTLTERSEVKIWSSISFVYYQVSELDRLLNELDQHLGGMGAVPTAIDIWNLVPWSWLVDWFTNLNHVVTNLSFLGRDGLHMQRGYLMAHYQSWQEYRVTGTVFGSPQTTVGVLYQERKYRIAASPFGFGYTWKDFDPFQLSILGALGVSRLRF